jgi:DNA-binding XRE family transcriptional regulator
MKEIILNSGAIALVDDEDYEIVSQYKWQEAKAIREGKYYTSYALAKSCGSNKTRKTISMHRLIMNTPAQLVVDHINHNGLDNRKENLRNVTRSENQRNLRPGSQPRHLNFNWRENGKRNSKLTQVDIDVIINSKGVLQRELAERFNVTQQTISLIKRKYESSINV